MRQVHPDPQTETWVGRKSLRQMLLCLPVGAPGREGWVLTWTSGNKESGFDRGEANCRAAIENMLIAAAAMNPGSVWIGGFDPQATRIRRQWPLGRHGEYHLPMTGTEPAPFRGLPLRTDIVRALTYLIVAVIAVAVQYPLLLLSSGALFVVTALWLLIRRLARLDFSSAAWPIYVIVVIDLVAIAAAVTLTGNVNSVVSVFFIGLTALRTLDRATKQGELCLAFSIAAMAALGTLAYLRVIPRMNVFGGGTDISIVSLPVSVGLFSLVSVAVYVAVNRISADNKKLIAQLASEKQVSDRLLLNVLPARIATELRDKGQSRPSKFDSVSVVFTDFAGFTASTRGIEPIAVIGALDAYFTRFDSIIAEHNLERLKTIGDGYMCAGGLPAENRTHPVDACLAALRILAESQGDSIRVEPRWKVRIGIHTGPVIAGIVGRTKFSYDIWGETVNLASRYESTGLPDRVNVSKNTYMLTKGLFRFEPRGVVPMKGVEATEVFLLSGLRPEYLDGDGRTNSKFAATYEAVARGEAMLGYDV